MDRQPASVVQVALDSGPLTELRRSRFVSSTDDPFPSLFFKIPAYRSVALTLLGWGLSLLSIIIIIIVVV